MPRRELEWPDSPLVLFWQEKRVWGNARLTREKSRKLAAEHNRHPCSLCRRVPSEQLVAVARCLNCEQWVCFRCHDPSLPFGSVGDFNYFLIDADRFEELSCAGVWLWPVLCPRCRTEVPRCSAVHLHRLPEDLRAKQERVDEDTEG